MKIVFLITLVPGQISGIEDYTERLCDALKAKGCEAYIESIPRWSLSATNHIKRRHQPSKETIFHLQYPTPGMGNSIVPGLLPIIMRPSPVYVTLQEFCVFNPLRKLIWLPAIFFSRGIMFSNEFERDRFCDFFPFTAGEKYVVPLGTNISNRHPRLEKIANNRIIYFGLVPGEKDKGIELFLEIIRELRQRMATFDAAIIGGVTDRGLLFKKIQQWSALYNIDLLLDMDEEKVSHALNNSTVALLPFPDGVSEKRGSALACLDHGNVVVTKHSPKTPSWMRNCTYHFNSIDHACQIILSILKDRGKSARELDLGVMRDELNKRQWSHIAEEHIRIYRC